MWTDRTEILIDKEGICRLKNSTVAVIGLGGVGGWVANLLVRAGVGSLIIVDFDKIDETNINRQLVANIDTVGCQKTQVMKDTLLKINPECIISVFDERFDKSNAEKILKSKKIDYVVDAIDSVGDKIELICFCKENNIEIVSAMGAGNRIGIPSFKVVDIYKTANDGLAKIVRKKLRERNIDKLTVVVSESLPIKSNSNKIGSISYQPAMCGCVLSAYVVENLRKEK